MTVTKLGSIYDKDVSHYDLEDIVRIIKSDELKEHCEYLRTEEDKKKRQAYKGINLPVCIVSGKWTTRDKDIPLVERWVEDSGNIILDYDEFENKEDVHKLKERVSKLSWVTCAFISPSGGLKVIVSMNKVDTSSDVDHKRRWAYSVKEIKRHCGAMAKEDSSGKDPARLCFLSHDPDIYFNPSSDVLKVPEDWGKPELFNSIESSEIPWPMYGEKIENARSRVKDYIGKIHATQGDNGHTTELVVCRHLANGFNIKDRGELEELFRDWNKTNAHPPMPENEIIHKVEQAWNQPPKDGKPRGHLNVFKHMKDNGPSLETKGKRKLALKCFTETDERKPEWLWRGYLLKGSSHVLGGKQGTSKGLFTVDIASRLSRGDPMPDGTGGGEPKKVLIVTREDSPEDALKPRLRVAGARMKNVSWTYGDFTDGKSIASMQEGAESITEAVKEHGFDLVIIDPLGSWVEDDMNNSQSVRAVIDPMSKMARDTGCTVLFVAHLKKSPTDDLMDAFSGSAQVTAAVRVALHIGPASQDGKRKILNVVKTNYKRPDNPMVYELWKDTAWEEDEPPILSWRDATDEDKSLANPNSKDSITAPEDLILELMLDGHTKTKEASRFIQSKLKAKGREWKRISLKSIETSMRNLEIEGMLFYGETIKGAQTIGKEPAPKLKKKWEKAMEAYLENSDSTVRKIADEVGCSIAEAQKGVKQAKVILKDEQALEEKEAS